MDNFKFNFPSQDQLESLNLEKFFLPLFKIYHAMRIFLVPLFLPFLIDCSVEIIVN